MKQLDINSVDELLNGINSLPNNYIYRGHADADWRLESSLERLIGAEWCRESAVKCEERSLDLFKSKFHLYDRENIQPNSKLSWLAIMQHYGVPTRLLDFTESPYVALYFALEAYKPQTKKDFTIFAIDYTAAMQKSIDYISDKDTSFRETRQSVYARQDAIFDEVVDKRAYDIAWIAEPKQFNRRLDHQAGSFLLAGNPGSRIQDILDSLIYTTVGMMQFRISANLYQAAFALLRKMNVTSKSLYGDLEGFAHSVRMELQAYSV